MKKHKKNKREKLVAMITPPDCGIELEDGMYC